MRLLLLLLLLAAPAAAAPTYPQASDGGPVALSPDGRLLATGGAAKVARVWDVQTGLLVRELKGPGPAVTERSFGPDSTYEVEDRITSLAFDPEGKRLATTGEDGFVRLWSIADGRLLDSHEDGYVVYGAAFSPAGDRLGYVNNSTRYLESSVMLWNLATGDVGALVDGIQHDGTIGGFRFRPDGQGMVSWGNGTMRVWSLAPGEAPVASWQGGSDAAWSPDGAVMAVGAETGAALRDPETGEVQRTLASGIEAPVRRLEYSPDGALLAGFTGDNTLVVWDVATGRKLFDKPVGRLFFWTRPDTVAVQTRDGRVAWLDGRTGKALASAP